MIYLQRFCIPFMANYFSAFDVFLPPLLQWGRFTAAVIHIIRLPAYNAYDGRRTRCITAAVKQPSHGKDLGKAEEAFLQIRETAISM